jgi:hypothetical protein
LTEQSELSNPDTHVQTPLLQSPFPEHAPGQTFASGGVTKVPFTMLLGFIRLLKPHPSIIVVNADKPISLSPVNYKYTSFFNIFKCKTVELIDIGSPFVECSQI